MKRLFIILLNLILTAGLSADVKFLGGINLSKYNSSANGENIQWNYRLGFLGGMGLEKKLTGSISLELDVLFFQKGSKAKYSDSPSLESLYNLNTVSLPLLIKVKISEGSSPYVLGGMEISSLLSHDLKRDEEEPVDLKEDTGSFDFGLVLGCGYELEIQEQLFIFLETRYHIGMKNIRINPSNEQSWKTQAILLILGVKS